MKRFIILAALLLGSLAARADGDIDTLTERYLRQYLERAADPAPAEVEEILATLFAPAEQPFDASRHLGRLETLAAAYRTPGNRHADSPAVLETILRGLDLFIEKNPVHWNWWFNDIGYPQQIMAILIMLKGKIDTPVLHGYSAYLKDRTDNRAHQGKNRTWVSDITVGKGCIEDDPALVRTGVESFVSTIRVIGDESFEVEGIQPDGSIHQHRPQLYNGGYGMSMCDDYSRYIEFVSGTSYAALFTPEKMKIIADLMLGGQMVFGYRSYFDFGAIGRGVSGENGTRNTTEATLQRMARVDSANAHRYNAWIDHLNGGPYPEPGNKYFWRSDIMTHHGANYYMSAKVLSTRTNGTEMLNQENLLGYYLPLGATNIATDGREYYNIFAIWDWTRVPGTTSILNKDSAALRWYHFGSNEFGGGVSDGRAGTIAYDNVYNGIYLRKAYFFAGDAMLCLGADINAVRTNTVATSVNQCFADGPATIGYTSGARETLGVERIQSRDVRWVWHDGVGYLFPEGGNVTVQSVEQTGSWRNLRINGSERPVSGEVFSVWLDHTTRPRGENYCYVVMPTPSVSDFERSVAANAFTVLRNDREVQAVHNTAEEVWWAVFYKPSTVELAPGFTLSTDKRVIVMIRSRDGGYEISAADPVHDETEATLTLNRKLSGPGARTSRGATNITVHFPGGDHKGDKIVNFYK